MATPVILALDTFKHVNIQLASTWKCYKTWPWQPSYAFSCLFIEDVYDVGASFSSDEISVISLANGRHRRQVPSTSTSAPTSAGPPAGTTQSPGIPTTSPDLSEYNIVHVSSDQIELSHRNLVHFCLLVTSFDLNLILVFHFVLNGSCLP